MKTILFLLLLIPSGALAVPAFVQSNSCTDYSASVDCAYSGSPAADSVLVVCAGTNSGAAAITCSDDQSGGYTSVINVRSSEDSGTTRMAVFVSTQTTEASTTVTCTASGATAVQVAIHEYSGVTVGSSPVDVFSSSAPINPSANPTSAEMTTTLGGSLIFSCAFFQGGAASAGSGTERTDYVNNWYHATQDEVQSAAGAITSNFTAASGNYVMGQVALTDADGEPPPSEPSTGYGYFR